jgi:hypothetical protein
MRALLISGPVWFSSLMSVARRHDSNRSKLPPFAYYLAKSFNASSEVTEDTEDTEDAQRVSFADEL